MPFVFRKLSSIEFMEPRLLQESPIYVKKTAVVDGSEQRGY